MKLLKKIGKCQTCIFKIYYVYSYPIISVPATQNVLKEFIRASITEMGDLLKNIYSLLRTKKPNVFFLYSYMLIISLYIQLLYQLCMCRSRRFLLKLKLHLRNLHENLKNLYLVIAIVIKTIVIILKKQPEPKHSRPHSASYLFGG